MDFSTFNDMENRAIQIFEKQILDQTYEIFSVGNIDWEYYSQIARNISRHINNNNYPSERLFDLVFHDQNHPQRRCLLALFYDFGIGVDVNREMAFKLYKEAAEDDDLLAQIEVGRSYETGIGVEKNPEKAFWWYQKASLKNFSRGFFFVGSSYELGVGTTKNSLKAFEYYLLAEAAGYTPARLKLAYCYKVGSCAPKNELKEIYWYKKASECRSNLIALSCLGCKYVEGSGFNKDIHEAFRCFTKGLKYGDPDFHEFLKLFCKKSIYSK
ncbi:hypothetical protein G9A89_000989 [Geosiphon pyriformis]|nr:hypothetical protein G9A89_000989 [Geosiphon pyriformis]